MARMNDDGTPADDESGVKLFGDPRSAVVYRGPERRTESVAADDHSSPSTAAPPTIRYVESHPTIRLGRGDGFATFLLVLGVLVFGVTVVAGTLILYNAKNVGAFSNPWDSTRVAIGSAVLAVGTVQAALLVGLSRATSYLLALLRQRSKDHDHHGIGHD